MKKTLSFPVKKVGKDEWLDLTAHGLSHEFCAEKSHQKPEYSFGGGHRVRHFAFRKNVHWLMPSGITIDIADVEPEVAAPGRRHNGRKK